MLADSDEVVNHDLGVSMTLSEGSKKTELTVLKMSSSSAPRKERVLEWPQEGMNCHG